MKKRTVDYLNRKKAFFEMRHPTDVKSLLIAEFNASRNILVKKDILKVMNEVDQMGKNMHMIPKPYVPGAGLR